MSSYRKSFALSFANFMLALVVSLLSAELTFAQSTAFNSGHTPPGVAPGNPNGNYSLSDIDDVNLFNGNLRIVLPLTSVAGRGSAGFAPTLRIESLAWNAREYQTFPNQPYKLVEYNTQTSSNLVGYSPGKMFMVSAVDNPQPGYPYDCSNWSGEGGYVLTRLKFVDTGGTEMWFHDQMYGGQIQSYSWCMYNNFTNRKRVFVTSNGEAATFVSDVDIIDTAVNNEWGATGYLFMRDGTRYRFVNGEVISVRDRNGNFIERNPNNSNQYIDSLKRTTTLSLTTQSTGCDVITFYGYNNATRQVKIWYSPLSNALRTGFTIKTIQQLFPEIFANNPYPYNTWQNYTHDPTVVSRVELPDGRSYQFYYDSYGTVARIILPTGGGYDYEYKGCGDIIPGSNPPTQGSFLNGIMYYRRLGKRTVYNTLTPTTSPTTPPAGTVEGYTVYNDTYSSATYPMSATCVTLNKYDANNTLLSCEKRYFCGYPTTEAAHPLTPVQYTLWPFGKEHKIEQYQVSGGSMGSLLRKSEQTWYPTTYNLSPFIPAPNPKLAETITTLAETGQVAKISYVNPSNGAICYDQYNNPTDMWEYDFGATTPSRNTHIEYQTAGYDTLVGGMYNPDPLATIHLRSLVTKQQIRNAAGNVTLAETNYEYDNYTPDAGNLHANLVARANITCLDPIYANTTSNVRTQRGNVTKLSRWLNTGSPVENWMQYDVAGNVVATLDARSTTATQNVTSIEYNDRFGIPDGNAQLNTPPTEVGTQMMTYAFPTKVTSPAPFNFCTYQQFDYQTGKPVDFEDANQIRYSSYYNDPLERLTEVRKAVGATAVTTKSRIFYADVVNNVQVRRVTVTGDFNAFGESDNETGTGLKSVSRYDGLGRTYRSATCEGSTWAITATEFDGLGRVRRVTNPFRGTGATGYDQALPGTPEWTTTTYDGLSRAISVATPDGATVGTAYQGAQVCVTDQDNKKRISETDGLGRLRKVWEVMSGGPDSITFNGTTHNGYCTIYGYDLLDNLTTVTQGTQTRTFAYDSLKRLTSATNPESGTTTYVYDPSSNLLNKIDARTTKTTFAYDALNRPTQKTYSGTTAEGVSAANATPSVYYKYDNQTLPAGAPLSFNRGFATGRLVAVTYGSGAAGSYYGYDELGRVLRRAQKFDGNTTDYTVTATYNRAGAMTGETYPSGNTVSYGYDMASRLTSFSGNLGGTQTTYATVTQFNPASQIERENYGMTTPLYLKQAYNNRLQLVDTRLGSVNDATSWDRGRLSLVYGTTTFNLSNTRDSANAELTVADLQGNNADNNGNVKRMYSFLPNGTIPQRDDYTYDPLNRLATMTECQRQTAGGAMVANIASQTYLYDRWGNNTITGTSPSGLTFNAINNRINMAGYVYDSAGNLISQGGQGRAYDAENRITSAASIGFYTYDGEGKRVKRTANGTTYCYVYGINGELLAEYMGASSLTLSKQYGYKDAKLLVTAEGATLKWLVQDHLGSTRMELTSTGAVDKRRDYLPFGEELLAGTVRSAANAYDLGGATRQRFGSKERDTETGLDFFGARYFASMQGRFTSADNFLNDTHVYDPASWNLYAYVRNNPLKYIDPTGEEIFSTNLSDEEKKKLIADLQNKTGFKSISFDKNNKLVIDAKAGFEKGSAAARTQLLAAVDSTDTRFNLKSVDNLKVAFASVDAGTTINVGGKTVRTDYTVSLDFGDFNRVSGDNEAKAAFSIGLVALHEFAHKVYNISDFPNSDTNPGPLENTYLNPIRRELGLAERAYYTSKQVPASLKSFFPGGGQELKFKLNEKEKILRWRNDLVGGKVQ